MSRNRLDEMQLQQRNKIGNQAFTLLCYLLMIDIVLYGLGVTWLKYPVNVFIIIIISCTYYSVRTIWNGAHVGVTNTASNISKKFIFTIILTFMLSAAVAMFVSKSNLIKINTANNGDNGGIILLVVSLISLVILITLMIISQRREKNYKE